MSDDDDSKQEFEWELIYEPPAPGSHELILPGQRKILRASIIARLDAVFHRGPTLPTNPDYYDDLILSYIPSRGISIPELRNLTRLAYEEVRSVIHRLERRGLVCHVEYAAHRFLYFKVDDDDTVPALPWRPFKSDRNV